ncbi:NAD(P)-dependent oxidoreductase [Agrobacterium vitis]|uniref:NAD(P)-dependent oxidoreductase n=1 Tax=Agrobacterium vitis TaxID=373 RepID=UPI0020350BFF|nr:NAD(P)-dependent oxidoreductase [Agrobacterium vitis]MCM2453356.1 NAD(P)-dependent oxidoreductase [Agrobacterium vitis]
MPEAKTTVGVIGLGSMGLGMAQTLVTKKFRTVGFDLAADRRKLAEDAGVEPMLTIGEVITASDFLVFSLPTAQDVSGVVESHLDLFQAKSSQRVIIIDTSTSEPDVSRDLANRLTSLGHGFLDAPVSGGPAGAASGKLTMMIGGSEEDLALARPVIEAMAAKALHVGQSGAGNVAKLVNNLLAAAHMITTSEGLKLALAAGIDPEAALRVVNAASGKSMISDVHFPTWVMSDRFDSGFSMGLMRKDVRLAKKLADSTGARLPLSDHVASLWAGSTELADSDDFTRMGAFKQKN